MCRMGFAQVEDQSATWSVMDSACQWMNYHGFRNFPKLSVVIRESGAVLQTIWEIKRWPFCATTEPSTNTTCELFALVSARDTHANRTKRTLDRRALFITIKNKSTMVNKCQKTCPHRCRYKHSFTALLTIVTYRCTKFQWVCKLN